MRSAKETCQRKPRQKALESGGGRITGPSQTGGNVCPRGEEPRRSGGRLIVTILHPDSGKIVARVRFSSGERQCIEAALKGNWAALPDFIERAVSRFISIHKHDAQRRAA